MFINLRKSTIILSAYLEYLLHYRTFRLEKINCRWNKIEFAYKCIVIVYLSQAM